MRDRANGAIVAGRVGVNVRSLDRGGKENEEHAQGAQRLRESAPLSIEVQRHVPVYPKYKVSRYYRIPT